MRAISKAFSQIPYETEQEIIVWTGWENNLGPLSGKFAVAVKAYLYADPKGRQVQTRRPGSMARLHQALHRDVGYWQLDGVIGRLQLVDS